MDDLQLRQATQNDIAILVKHRRWMFDDMLAAQKVNYSFTDLDVMELAYRNYLAQHLGGIVRGWLRIAAASLPAAQFCFTIGRRGRATRSGGQRCCTACILTPGYRRRGLARRLAQTMIDVCRELGLRTVSLHGAALKGAFGSRSPVRASGAGRSLYESLGFHATSEMRLTVR